MLWQHPKTFHKFGFEWCESYGVVVVFCVGRSFQDCVSSLNERLKSFLHPLQFRQHLCQFSWAGMTEKNNGQCQFSDTTGAVGNHPHKSYWLVLLRSRLGCRCIWLCRRGRWRWGGCWRWGGVHRLRRRRWCGGGWWRWGRSSSRSKTWI